MALYRNTNSGEIRELDSALVAAWQAFNNPKARIWETYTPPPPPEPPPPAPDWARFRTQLQTDNGFPAAWTTILQGDSRAAIMLIASLSVWQASPDQWGQFLAAIGACLLLLPPAQAAEVGLELLVTGQDCHLDPAFLVALESMLNQGAP